MTPPIALTIAGSDSSAGAGLQADLKTFSALGVFGTTAVTAVTAQNTRGVDAVEVLPLRIVDAQISSVVTDLGVAAVKTGMLATASIVGLVADRAAAGDLPNLVVDPVMVATSGDRLLDPDAEAAYVDELFAHATVVTPNLREAAVLVGRPVESVIDMAAAAHEIAAHGPELVVVKGGHLTGDAVDVVVHRGDQVELRAPRVTTRNVHGTGCTFAAATAAGLAQGLDAMASVTQAKRFVTTAIAGASQWHLGAGQGPVDHFNWEEQP